MNVAQGKFLALEQVTFSTNTTDSEPTKKYSRMPVATEQEFAEVTAVDLPPFSPLDSSADIVPEGALGETTALGWTLKMWCI